MSAPTSSEQLARHLLQGGGALLVWALHFFGAYVLVATGCCSSFADAAWVGVSALRISLWALSVLAAGLIVVCIVRGRRLPRSLLRSAAVGGGALALIGVAWTTLPMLGALPLCHCQP